MGLLRVLLAILVVSAHLGYPFGVKFIGPKVAVQSFYIISGFYMAMVLTNKYKNSSYPIFIGNRLLRIWPTYITVLTITIVASIFCGINTGHFLAIQPYLESYNQLSLINLIGLGAINFTLLLQDVVVFFGIENNIHLTINKSLTSDKTQLYEFMLIPQAWTLSLELMFYLIVPFLNKIKTISLIGLMIFSLFIRLSLSYYGYQNDPWDYRFFPSELIFFLGGMLIYRLSIKNNFPKLNLTFIVCLLVLMATIVQVYFFTITKIIFLITLTISIPILFNFTKNSTWDNKIAAYSYPIYISHYLYIMIANLYFETLSKEIRFIFVLILTIATSKILIGAIDPIVNRIKEKRITASNSEIIN